MVQLCKPLSIRSSLSVVTLVAMILMYIWMMFDSHEDPESVWRRSRRDNINIWSNSQEPSMSQVMARAEGPLSGVENDTVRFLVEHYLHPPSHLPYNLKELPPKDLTYLTYKRVSSSWGFTNSILRDLFSDKPSGFFVEAGALDGEFLSNTLQLERHFGWTGLLVEADQESYNALKGKHRKAWSSPACISTKSYPRQVILTSYRKAGTYWTERGAARIEKNAATGGGGPGYRLFHRVQCFPAITFFLALEVSKIHFFSLDVEGAEFDILRHFPFDQIEVDVWVIEHVRRPKEKTVVPAHPSNASGIWEFEDLEFIAFMEARKYYLFDMFCHPIPDYVFINRNSEIFQSLEVPRAFWKRHGICLQKEHWTKQNKEFSPEMYRDKRHWPSLRFSER